MPDNAARTRVSAILIIAAAVLLLAACATSASETPIPTASAGAVSQLGPEDFAEEIASGDRFVVNVHTPDEGRIDGTNADIPFDQLKKRAAELPQDRSTPIAVYCRSGRMSQIAVDTLAGMGYVDLVELQGGMIAWEADGRALSSEG